ncbi:SpoIIIAH-like family protein [Alteribacillus sp. YIM 98480]|uniref:SpoIIIAH-like family protein n=1 Tax=Alteribacillus sp. YIM 98480 TaxID=2606599 RepID=UPI00131AECE6|nr:SpoIIIAH-like family protein [Alteribacillus sp. YIM 98480]
MVLKKQTVWLMTMLSLTIVLAVYYITSPSEVAENDPEADETSEMTAATEDEEWVEWLSEEDMETTIEETEPPTEGEETGGEEEVPAEEAEIYNENQEANTQGNLFSELRLERDESRSRLREEYTDTIASEDYSAAEKSEAFDRREQLQETQQNESMLESLIQSEGYEDAVVISEEDRTRIIVQAEELSREDAVMLNRLAAEHLDVSDVVIGHQATAAGQ